MTDNRRRPMEITDAPEHRAIPIDSFEVHDSPDDGTLRLVGYASTFEPYEMNGGPATGVGWIEQIDPGAFERTLKEGPDLHLLINHQGLPLARTKSGNLHLSVDDHGLRVEASLDRSDPDVQRLEPKMRKRDDGRPLMDEMSFAFRVKAHEWSSTPEFRDDPQAFRRITEVSLHKGDVSVVNFGANPTTSAELKSVPDALRILAECDPKELVEMRSDAVSTVRAKLDLASEERAPQEEDDSNADEQSPNTLIAAADAALDEAVALLADADLEKLPPKVAQALDLLSAAWTIIGKLMDVSGIYDPDDGSAPGFGVGRSRDGALEERAAVSDHAWDFPQSAYSDEQWRRACLIDTGDGGVDTKARYKLPVREPNGTLNRRGVHAAAGRLDQVQGISDGQRSAAAKKLVSLYRDELKEDPPQHLLDMAHERSAELAEALEAIADLRGVVNALVERMGSTVTDAAVSAGGMSLREALVSQGFLPDGELSLSEALALD